MDRMFIFTLIMVVGGLVYFGFQPAPPVDLKYTATDGTQVDLASERQERLISEEEITKEMSELNEAKQTLAQFLADTGIEIMHTTIQT